MEKEDSSDKNKEATKEVAKDGTAKDRSRSSSIEIVCVRSVSR